MNTFIRSALSVLVVAILTPASFGAYDEVSCDSNPDFSANSCNQCFDGGAVSAGDNKGLLTDIWKNTSSGSQVLFKEEQEMPKIISLGGSTWTEVKASEDVTFWQYTSALDALYSETDLGYVLPKDQSVTWLESTLGSAYQLTTNTAANGANVGLLSYDIVTHQVDADGTPALESDSHRECVLYTSTAGSTPVTPPVTPPTELPQTGPEHILLVLVALMLGLGFMRFRKQA